MNAAEYRVNRKGDVEVHTPKGSWHRQQTPPKGAVKVADLRKRKGKA